MGCHQFDRKQHGQGTGERPAEHTRRNNPHRVARSKRDGTLGDKAHAQHNGRLTRLLFGQGETVAGHERGQSHAQRRHHARGHHGRHGHIGLRAE